MDLLWSVRCGGAGVVVTRGDSELPERGVCGDQAEVLAMREALVWLSECESA